MKDEGYIKFNCHWIKNKLMEKNAISDLNYWRQKLYNHKLIGAYPDGIGYGNISSRVEENVFIITGSATGNIRNLTDEHYAKVTNYNIQNNSITCKGQTQASSESLTHAIIYESIPHINAVVHIHNGQLWNKLINTAPTTSSKVPYGTPEMAFEISKLLQSPNAGDEKIIIMAGHEEGIITFGESLGVAVNQALKLYDG